MSHKQRVRVITTLKRTLAILLYVIVAIYLGAVIMLNVPYFQRKITRFVTHELEQMLETRLTIQRIDMGLLNRIVIDGLELKDQNNKPLLSVSRFSASFEILPLLQGKVSVRSVQLFGFKAMLYKQNQETSLNCQFLIDAFFGDEEKESTQIDLRINSLLMRQGTVSYDLYSAPYTPEQFSPSHFKVNDIRASVSLKHYSPDSLNLSLKRMSFKEESGLELSKLKFHLIANKHTASLTDFECQLPHSAVNLSEVRANYASLKESGQIGDSLFFSFQILPSSVVSPTDLTPILPGFAHFDEPIHLEMAIDGKLNYLNIRDIHIYSGQDHTKKARLQGRIHLKDLMRQGHSYIDAAFREIAFSAGETEKLIQSLQTTGIKLPPVLGRIGSFSMETSLQGFSNNLKGECSIRSDIGKINTTLHYQSLSEGSNNKLVSCNLTGEEVNLGILLANKKLGSTSFVTRADITMHNKEFTAVKAQGSVTAFEYLGYNYQDIVFDGVYTNKGFDGLIRLNDPNGIVDINGRFDLTGKTKEYHLLARIHHLNLHNLHLAKNYQNYDFSLLLNADFSGNKADEMLGSIRMDSITIRMPDKDYSISHVDLKAFNEDKIRKVYLDSPFLQADLHGHFDYTTLPTSVINMLKQYTPSLLSSKTPKVPRNNFDFSIRVSDTQALTDIFKLPFTIYETSSFTGFIQDDTHSMRLEGEFPRFNYGSLRFQDVSLLCNNTPENFDCKLTGNALMKNNMLLNLNLFAKAKEDQVETTFQWQNYAENEYRGTISLSALLRKSLYSNRLLADISILPADVMLEDSLWHINPATIRIDSSRIDISGFALLHEAQALRVDGTLSKSPEDSLHIDLTQFNLGYLFDVMHFHSVDFNGTATGKVTAYDLFNNPQMDGVLHVNAFRFNEVLLGNMDVTGGWNAQEDIIALNARIREEGLSVTQVMGEVHPKRKDLDLSIRAAGTNVEFIQPYVEDIISDVHGRAQGNYRLFGGFKSLDIEGEGIVDASFEVDILGVPYALKDSIHIFPGQFVLRNAKIYDEEGHDGSVTALLSHTHFSDFQYRLQVQSNSMMILNKRETFDLPFYGKVYASGNSILTGNSERLDVTAGLTTSNKTEFVYKMTSATTATSTEFVRFTNGTSNEEQLAENSLEADNSSLEVYLNLSIDANPQAVMKVIVDPRAGDYISCTGSGNILLEFFNKGDLRMFGTYTLNQGVYKFSLQEVIRKEFTIRNGSSVSFNGDPYRANCNINAIYTVNSVSLRDLGTDVVNALQHSQSNVKVNCLMDITGILSSPEIRLGIEIPNENEEVQRVVRNFISTEDQMNMQFLYLLGIGKFYTPDYANKTGQNSDAMSSVLSSTLSGQLNNMLSQVINSNKWNFGVNSSTGVDGWTDMEFQGMLSGQLLNNRLLINGNFGYRDNSMTNSSQSNFIGDFDIEYLLTKTGDVRLKAYNKSNDRYSTKTTLNTQGVGVLYKKDFNSWWEFIPRKKKKKK